MGAPRRVRPASRHDGLEKRWASSCSPRRATGCPSSRRCGCRTAARGSTAAVRRRLLERYGIEIGGGVGPFAGKVWRIGCMGHTARPRNVTLLLAALEEVLAR